MAIRTKMKSFFFPTQLGRHDSRAAASHRSVPAGSALALRRRFTVHALLPKEHDRCEAGRRAPGVSELEVYFDPAVAMEEKIIFSKYVHEHLLQHARDVERLRHYVCPECGTPVGNRRWR